MLILLQSGGLLFYYQAQQYLMKQHMLKVVHNPNSLTTKLSLSFVDYQSATINQHEISLHGKLYDIKDLKIVKDKVELEVINDTGEENIIDDISETVSKNEDSKSKDVNGKLIEFLGLFYIVPSIPTWHCFSGDADNEYNCYHESGVSRTPEKYVPPPEVI